LAVAGGVESARLRPNFLHQNHSKGHLRVAFFLQKKDNGM